MVHTSRRRFLTVASTTSIVALAGCSGLGDDDGGDSMDTETMGDGSMETDSMDTETMDNGSMETDVMSDGSMETDSMNNETMDDGSMENGSMNLYG